ncbi:RluA Pseudouridylate synthases, 23S RNA-specific [Rhabdaerophilaceae bacterium]
MKRPVNRKANIVFMTITAADLKARLLHQDEDILVLNKPYGIAVHAGPKGGVTLDAFLPDLKLGNPDLPQLAHRLDRETTGCLILGRNAKSLKRLGGLFAEGKIGKTYLALVCGRPVPEIGMIDLPLARRTHDRRSWWMKVDAAGDVARTRYEVLGQADGLALLALSPQTGRTHQLRVHCAHMGWPIAGDRIYGGDRAMATAPGLMLHAVRIVIPRGRGQEPLVINAPLPETLTDFLAALGLPDAYDPEGSTL